MCKNNTLVRRFVFSHATAIKVIGATVIIVKKSQRNILKISKNVTLSRGKKGSLP